MELSDTNKSLKQHKHLTILKIKKNQNQEVSFSTARTLKNFKITNLKMDGYGSFNNCHCAVFSISTPAP